MNRLKSFFHLRANERNLLLKGLFYVANARVLVTFRTFPSLCSLLNSASPPCAGISQPADRVAWAIGVASRIIPGSTCLVQSVAAHLLLRRTGHPAVLCLSVHGGSGVPFRAHASVESNGRTLIGGAAGEGFTRIAGIG